MLLFESSTRQRRDCHSVYPMLASAIAKEPHCFAPTAATPPASPNPPTSTRNPSSSVTSPSPPTPASGPASSSAATSTSSASARAPIQDGSVLHVMRDTHPLVLGDNVTIGHGVVLHGCTIESRCLIGMGSIILNGVKIGTGSIVAAGTLSPKAPKSRPAASSWATQANPPRPNRRRPRLHRRLRPALRRIQRNLQIRECVTRSS